MFGKNVKYKQNKESQKSEKKGFIWNVMDKYSTPLERYSSIVGNTTPVMREGGGLHGNSRYYRAYDNEHYIRLQVVASNDSYVEINAKKVRIEDAKKNAEAIGFSALSGQRSDNTMLGIVSSYDEIHDFLDEVWDRWVNVGENDGKNLGSKWKKVVGGFIRKSDNRFFNESNVSNSSDGWNVYKSGDEYIPFHENDIEK